MSSTRKSLRHRTPAKTTTCLPAGKVRYPDGRAAIEALHLAATSRHFAALDGLSTRRRECRHYRCLLCKGWHLTSRPASLPAQARRTAA